MPSARDNNPNIDALLDAACDGFLSEADRATLEIWLAGHPEDADAYVEYLRLHAELAWLLDPRPPFTIEELRQHATAEEKVVGHDEAHTFEDRIAIAVAPRSGEKRATSSLQNRLAETIHWQRHKIRFSTLSAVLTLLAWASFSYVMGWSTLSDDSRPDRSGTIQYVAEITGQYEHRWAEGMPPMFVRHVLLSGERLNLVEGLIEITFDDGAVVVLEGPAEFVVDSSGAGTLEVGKLAATVPQRAVGFVVDTPSVRIVDLGTEFGVSARNGQVGVFVLDGDVEVHRVHLAGGRKGIVQLSAGGDIVLDSRGVTVNSAEPVSSSTFRWSMPLATIIHADGVSTSGNSGVAGTNIGFIIDGSGLSATVTDANFATVSHSVGFAPATDRWIDNTTTTVSNITFTFNSPVTLDQVLIWNSTQEFCCEAQGIDLFNIQVDTGGGFGGTVFSADINSSTHVLATHTAQVLNIGTQSGIVGLRFDIVTNQGYAFGIGLDEVVFRYSDTMPINRPELKESQ